MRRHYRNGWSRAAARVLAIAHSRAPMIRWTVLIALVLAWFVAGFIGWYGGSFIDEETGQHGVIGVTDAFYRTVGALSMSDIYLPRNEGVLNIARFAGLAVPLVGILFAFWGQLGRSLAQGLHQLAAHHIVIAGSGPAAVNLAQDCRRARKGGPDSVVLIAAGLPEDLAWTLRRAGIFVIDGVGYDRRTLMHARAAHAAHIVAFEDDDTANLQIEAAMRGAVQGRRGREPIDVHVASHSAMLLREARAMRSTEQGRLEARNKGKQPRQHERLVIDAKPFSLDEIAARRLVQTQAVELLELATQLGHERVHIVSFGFDEAAQAVVSHVFMSLWSARFEAPRVTVLVEDVADAEARFRARHPQALAYPDIWAADIVFRPFNVLRDHIDTPMLAEISQARGAATAVVVSAGADPDNIRLALALKRACNQGPIWPVPIFMKESTKSEFSSIYAKGDETEELDAYLLAFGALQSTATRSHIIEGKLDQGAAIAHKHYVMQAEKGEAPNMRELQAATRGWSEVLETYRAANRAVSDAAMVKVWDAGFKPMSTGRGEAAPEAAGEMMEAMARREHDRWMAERLLAGWRPPEPGGKRNNDLLIHDKIVGWDQLSENDKENDRVQIRASMNIARAMHPKGFEARG